MRHRGSLPVCLRAEQCSANSRVGTIQCRWHLPLQCSGTISDFISYSLSSFFKTPAHFCLSSFLLEPFYLIFPSPGMSTLDHHGADSFLSFISAFAGRPSLSVHCKVNPLPSNFNITLPFSIYSTFIIRIILNCLLNSCSFS